MKAVLLVILVAFVLPGCAEPAQTAVFEGCTEIEAVSVPSESGGSLAADDCTRGADYPVDYYEVDVEERTVVTVTTQSDAFAQAFLSVHRADSDVQLDGDVQDPGTESASVQAVLEPGAPYIIGVSGLNAGDAGDYTLTLAQE